MTVLDFYNVTRENYPDATLKADKEHILRWGEIDPEFAYSWFESLAYALNNKMVSGVNAANYKELLEFISTQYSTGGEEEKNCIDVAFTENLFWEVPSIKAKDYWQLLPENLKELYVSFHWREPL